jgi:hypothetical protein
VQRAAASLLVASLAAGVLPTAPLRALGADPAATAAPGTGAHAKHHVDEVMVHDHAPRHGGVVGMSGTRHVEIVLSRDTVRVYLSDLHRTPLALASTSGTVTLRDAAAPGTPRTVKLARRGDALEAPLPKLAGATVDARVELTTADGPVLIEFTLPVPTPP